jgi:heterodisulfide reductase subunit B
MIYSYYPGCTLKDRAKEMDKHARASAAALGIELREIPQWQCCGAVYPQASDEIASRLSAVRALMNTEEGKLVTMCSACHHVIKRTNYDWNRDADFRMKATNYMKPEVPYDGSTQVLHFLEVIRDEIGFEELKKKVVNPLTGRKIAAYYGCLLLRPGKVLQFDSPENPKIMEDFIRALGATPVIYPMRNECCGGYIAIESSEAAKKNSAAIYESAEGFGADCIITACPLCRYNLIKAESTVPVVYFTELLAEALGVK